MQRSAPFPLYVSPFPATRQPSSWAVPRRSVRQWNRDSFCFPVTCASFSLSRSLPITSSPFVVFLFSLIFSFRMIRIIRNGGLPPIPFKSLLLPPFFLISRKLACRSFPPKFFSCSAPSQNFDGRCHRFLGPCWPFLLSDLRV